GTLDVVPDGTGGQIACDTVLAGEVLADEGFLAANRLTAFSRQIASDHDVGKPVRVRHVDRSAVLALHVAADRGDGGDLEGSALLHLDDAGDGSFLDGARCSGRHDHFAAHGTCQPAG